MLTSRPRFLLWVDYWIYCDVIFSVHNGAYTTPYFIASNDRTLFRLVAICGTVPSFALETEENHEKAVAICGVRDFWCTSYEDCYPLEALHFVESQYGLWPSDILPCNAEVHLDDLV